MAVDANLFDLMNLTATVACYRSMPNISIAVGYWLNTKYWLQGLSIGSRSSSLIDRWWNSV